MSDMFIRCSSLKELNLNNFNTNNVTNMWFMFRGCSSLKELNLNNFNTSNVTSMKAMFYECTSLTRADLSNFDTSNIKDNSDLFGMFGECNLLKDENIIVKDKRISNPEFDFL